MKPSIGTFVDDSSPAAIDLPRLLETRLLVNANSGQGKSRALRRLLEQTAGQVQQIILDPEGEFASLREKHDLIICAAQGGDVALHPRTAALLARRLRETKVSAVLDFSELHAHQRKHVAKLFLEALVECPRSLWEPVLVAIDECQIFAPEKGHGESEALEAVADLTTRGRKRGLCLVAATLRISTLNKDVAAELKNRFIGGTVQDLDIKRLAFDLGMTPKDTLEVLRNLDPGHFLAYGPALHQKTPRELVTGEVFTTHPEVGKRRLAAPPKPTPAIVALLPKLADLPKEAEEQARSMEDLKRELAAARRELAQAKKSTPPPAAPSTEALQAAESRGFERGLTEAKRASDIELRALKSSLHAAVDAAIAGAPVLQITKPVSAPAVLPKASPAPRQVTARASTNCADSALSKAERLVLTALAQYPEGRTKVQIALLSGYAHTGGGFNNALSALRTRGLLEGDANRMTITEEGLSVLGPYEELPRGPDLLDHWMGQLSKAEKAALSALVQAYPGALTKQEVADQAGYDAAGGGFNNALSRLRTLELISGRGELSASKDLFV